MSQADMPTGADMEAAHEILAIINNISRGYYPGDRDGYTAAHLPFSPANPAHLRALYDRLKACIDKAPAGLHRVIQGFDMLIQTDILDASTATVELHPRIGRALAHMAQVDAREKLNALRKFGLNILPKTEKPMFEGAKMNEIGALFDCLGEGLGLGFRLKLPDARIITVTGLTADECREIASLFGEFVVLGLTAK